MKITDLTISDFRLYVTLDGYRFWTDTKYTILEMGYATYFLQDYEDEAAADWINRFGETIPGDARDGRSELISNNSMFITSNPVLFALAYNHWHDKRGGNEETSKIPDYEAALEIQRNREILNDFNLKYEGRLPKEIRG